ncbi:MAG TPA: hypothetical protein VFB66_31365 [Tepidisphaeraceae bacterium]|nr:hypothetical protein [Tepidisphaeraceae bacterium]
MIAVALFDLLARTRAAGSESGPEVGARLGRFAGRLVEAVLADLQCLRAYEQDLLAARATSNDDGLDRDVLRSLWAYYAQWAADAEQVLARVRVAREAGQVVRDADRLEEAHGIIRARVSITPEQIMRTPDEPMGHPARVGEFRK